MEIIDDIHKIKSVLKNVDSIGFVPTMGALHEGHLSLIQRVRKECDVVVVSIFVNPTQFLEGEDFDKYPKQLNQDALLCKKAGVDYIFAPNQNCIYFKDELSIKAPKIKSYILEGFHRAGHFDGVLQVVLKLFNIIKPTKAYFGKKDAQQLYLIKKMVHDLFLDIDIVECELIRDQNNLALSSRNAYLNASELKRALSISKALFFAKDLSKKIKDSQTIKQHIKDILDVDKIEYIEVVDNDFNKIKTILPNDTIILIAVIIGTTRLIDNIRL